jgi:hypothetical protein
LLKREELECLSTGECFPEEIPALYEPMPAAEKYFNSFFKVLRYVFYQGENERQGARPNKLSNRKTVGYGIQRYITRSLQISSNAIKVATGKRGYFSGFGSRSFRYCRSSICFERLSSLVRFPEEYSFVARELGIKLLFLKTLN